MHVRWLELIVTLLSGLGPYERSHLKKDLLNNWAGEDRGKMNGNVQGIGDQKKRNAPLLESFSYVICLMRVLWVILSPAANH